MGKTLTEEGSKEQAYILMQAGFVIEQLDVEYLQLVLDEMKEAHSMKDAIMILNPNPFIHADQQTLNKLKMEQLDLFLKLKRGIDQIRHQSSLLDAAKTQQEKLGKYFQ